MHVCMHTRKGKPTSYMCTVSVSVIISSCVNDLSKSLPVLEQIANFRSKTMVVSLPLFFSPTHCYSHSK